ncbi:MAG: hypothetical protein O7A71_03160, partial [Chloroflexi bacterium]|nr:hypothetical protein [Chloroflexota bacterium]
MSATNRLHRHVWWVVTAVVVVSVFLTTFAAIRGLGAPQSPLGHPVVRSTANDSQRTLTPAPSSAPPSAEPAPSLAPAPPGHSLVNGGAIEPPIPVVENPEGAVIAARRVPVVLLPPIDEAALTLGG